jgi:4-alpha-glucanotransferase
VFVLTGLNLVFLARQKSTLESGRLERFLRLLESGSELCGALYIAGVLLEAMPSVMIERIKALISTRKLELLGGAMFEPWLPLIPSVDAGYQLREHYNFLERLFGVWVKGFWLLDCAWEPPLASVIAGVGGEYTFLSSSQLERSAGIWITEDQGKTLRILGFDDRWLFLGFEGFAARVEELSKLSGVQTLVFELEDSELCLNELEGFFFYLDRAGLKPSLPSGLLETFKPQALIYPKPSWQRAEPWRAMLETPEINWLHKRSARASKRLNDRFRVPEKAFRHLYQAQSASLFGNPGAHREAYQHIIRAENILEPHKYAWLELEVTDLDCDGSDEVVAQAHTMNLFFKPNLGGSLVEFDDRQRGLNLVKRALTDHFIGAEESMSRFAAHQTLELGDFVTSPFEGSKYRDRISLSRLGVVRGPSGVPVPVEIKKAIRVLPKESKLEVEYRLTNHGDWDIVTRFGSAWELELHYLNPNLLINSVAVANPKPNLEHRGTKTVSLLHLSHGFEMRFEFGRETLLWSFENRDQLLLLPLWDLDLPKGRSRRIQFEVQLFER